MANDDLVSSFNDLVSRGVILYVEMFNVLVRCNFTVGVQARSISVGKAVGHPPSEDPERSFYGSSFPMVLILRTPEHARR
jgi:hypothetical protein